MLVPGDGALVAVEARGQRLVDVDHERVFLRRVEILGLDEDGREGLAVGVEVVDELGLAPVVLGLLGIGVADLAGVGEIGPLTQRSGNSSKRCWVWT